jgi:hypothetical protein
MHASLPIDAAELSKSALSVDLPIAVGILGGSRQFKIAQMWYSLYDAQSVTAAAICDLLLSSELFKDLFKFDFVGAAAVEED